MRVLAIDPGTEQSGLVLHEIPRTPVKFKVSSNVEIAENMIRSGTKHYQHVVLEMFACYGMPASDESIQTVVWTGRFAQIALQTNECPVTYIFRSTIRSSLCKSTKAGDPEVNQRLRDIYGKPGTKKEPGVLYGIKSHAWAALAVATAWEDIYPGGELDYLTFMPDGTWKGQAVRDELEAMKKRKAQAKREKRRRETA